MDQSSRKLPAMYDALSPEAAPSLAGPNVRLGRRPERGSHHPDEIYAIIDEAPICHVAFVADGIALTLPTAHARIGDQLYLHGAVKNGMLRALTSCGRASATFTLLDGLVLARTAFHHSLNYRSVVVIGSVSEVTDEDEKRLALHALVEQLIPGRMRELAPPTAAELRATCLVRVAIEQASAKTRAGDPGDSERDRTLDVWAGTIPLALTAGLPVPDRQLHPNQPPSAAALSRSRTQQKTKAVAQQRGEYVFSSDPTRLQLPFIHAFLRDESYWASGLEEAALRDCVPASLCFGVYRVDEQVGFARVVTDGSRFAYLCDVFIAEALRGRGLGQQLVEFVLAHPMLRDIRRIVLGTRDAHAFYEPFGFVRCESGRYMVRMSETSAG